MEPNLEKFNNNWEDAIEDEIKRFHEWEKNRALPLEFPPNYEELVRKEKLQKERLQKKIKKSFRKI